MELVESVTSEILSRLEKENVALKEDMLEAILKRVTAVILVGEEIGDREQYLEKVKIEILVDLIKASRT